MANYSMSPYAISFTPRYARGGERRPIDSLDNSGLTARSIIDGVLQSLRSDDLIDHPEDESRSLRVSSLSSFSDFTIAEIEVGRSGMVGHLHRNKGGRVAYGEKDKNGAMVRVIFAYPEAGHEVYLLNEKAGQISSFSHLEDRLLAALRAKTQSASLTVKIDPVSEWNALEAWADKIMVQHIRFDAPRPGGSTQAMSVNGIHADVQYIIKPRGSLTLSKLLGKNGPDRKAVFGFLTDLPLITKRSTPNTVIRDGWSAKVAFKTRSGRQRSFGIATEDKAPTLVYPVGPQGAGSGARRPEDYEFAEACAEFLNDMGENTPGLESVATTILSNITK